MYVYLSYKEPCVSLFPPSDSGHRATKSWLFNLLLYRLNLCPQQLITATRLRQPATPTTVFPGWCCRPPWRLSRPWRAARPARSQPAATPWQLPGTCPSSPESDVSLSLHAGCCPWQVVWGPWREVARGWGARPLCRADWAFDLSHRCGGWCTGL